MLAVAGVALILVNSPWVGGTGLVLGGLAAVMGWIVYPRKIRASKAAGAHPRARTSASRVPPFG
jgi:hypothetical protein